jgi:hypothetical protein
MKKNRYNEHAGIVLDVSDGTHPNFDESKLDRRCNKPYAIYAKDVDKVSTYYKVFKADIAGLNASFALPNEISISMSILEKAWEKSEILKTKIIELAEIDKDSVAKDNMQVQFDFIENIYTAIIFSYKSVESFCNASIPEDYTYEIVNNKGVIEIYKKKEIERWIKTSVKITKILPKVYACKNPNTMSFWPHFKELEKLRNEIVHSKSESTVDVFLKLISKEIELYLFSSMRILEYFIHENPNNEYLPMGLGSMAIQFKSVETFSDCMGPLK